MKKITLAIGIAAMLIAFATGCEKGEGPYPSPSCGHGHIYAGGYGYHECSMRQIGWSQYTCEPIYKCNVCGQTFPNDPVSSDPCQRFLY